MLYIITEDERAVFEGLTNEAEQEQFIEQFWYRRDPDLRTPLNEFKEEHYRRIAFANERFHSGKSGWRSDRGRIYIIHGPPDEIEDFGGGGQYVRESYEGGGTTTVHPFERWRYRKIDGLGSDITLEFVDESRTGEYRLALHPDEKDALIGLPGLGLTDSERLGLTQKGRRLHPDEMHNPYLRANMRRQGPSLHPFRDLRQVPGGPAHQVQRPPGSGQSHGELHQSPVRGSERLLPVEPGQGSDSRHRWSCRTGT